MSCDFVRLARGVTVLGGGLGRAAKDGEAGGQAQALNDLLNKVLHSFLRSSADDGDVD